TGLFRLAYQKQKMPKKENKNELSDAEKSQKIQSLRDMVNSAEKTIQSAKAMLLQLEGKKKSGRKRKIEFEGDGTIIEGTFDGQIMIGTDGKQYPVPANYASKSKLVEGDMLKLTITSDGSFIYKQIGPGERKHAIGIASQDEAGNYYVIAEGKPYKVLLASITYFKVDPGDEVAIVIPRDMESSWCAIESVLQKGKDKSPEIVSKNENSEIKEDQSVLDEWTSDIKEIENELQKNNKTNVE
ncbi:hypothetical protein ACFLY1_01095, partial [Patescibacteria group bacterium]